MASFLQTTVSASPTTSTNAVLGLIFEKSSPGTRFLVPGSMATRAIGVGTVGKAVATVAAILAPIHPPTECAAIMVWGNPLAPITGRTWLSHQKFCNR